MESLSFMRLSLSDSTSSFIRFISSFISAISPTSRSGILSFLFASFLAPLHYELFLAFPLVAYRGVPGEGSSVIVAAVCILVFRGGRYQGKVRFSQRTLSPDAPRGVPGKGSSLFA